MDYADFLRRIKEIKAMGFIKSHRQGDTGIGKTLEDLLGITENNISGPDFSTYELKAARKGSVSMLTLFTKAPQPAGANAALLAAFGYPQRKRATRIQHSMGNELHVTVDSQRVNSVGLRLGVEGSRVRILNSKEIDAYYEEAELKRAFEKKYHSLLYVLAISKTESGAEWFSFEEGYLLSGFSYARFSDLILEGSVKLDLRLGHYADGRPHDHGTGFRVKKRDLPRCFEKIEQIL